MGDKVLQPGTLQALVYESVPMCRGEFAQAADSVGGEVQDARPGVLLFDNSDPANLSTFFPDLCRLWVNCYGKGKRSLVAGL